MNIKMLLCVLLGMLYYLITFGKAGNINFTLELLFVRNGIVLIKCSDVTNFHVHHYMFGIFMLLLSCLISINSELIGFAIISTMHGLSYHDRFHFLETTLPV